MYMPEATFYKPVPMNELDFGLRHLASGRRPSVFQMYLKMHLRCMSLKLPLQTCPCERARFLASPPRLGASPRCISDVSTDASQVYKPEAAVYKPKRILILSYL